MRKKVFRLKGIDYYRKHLEILNGVIPVKLAPKDIDIIAILLDRSLEEIEDNLLSSDIKKKMREILKMSHQNLSVRLKNLKDRGFIYQEQNKWKLRSFLLPDPSGRTEYVIIVKNPDIFT